MSNRVNENNKVHVSGYIYSEAVFDHRIAGEDFYLMYLNIARVSGVSDILPVIVSSRAYDVDCLTVDTYVSVTGQMRSFNKQLENGHHKLVLNIFANEIEILNEPYNNDNNFIELYGFICKDVNYRTTPLGREIADIVCAVNRQYNKSDYLPLICWGRNAKYASTLSVGDMIHVKGRIQSREYQKRINNNNPNETETRIAYEISCSMIELVEYQSESEDVDE